jgi:amino acid transporter
LSITTIIIITSSSSSPIIIIIITTTTTTIIIIIIPTHRSAWKRGNFASRFFTMEDGFASGATIFAFFPDHINIIIIIIIIDPMGRENRLQP